jgi:hypothetical protein
LLQGTRLDLPVHGALQLVVLEEPLDGVPQREGIVVIAANDVEDALRDGGEDPVDDA